MFTSPRPTLVFLISISPPNNDERLTRQLASLTSLCNRAPAARGMC